MKDFDNRYKNEIFKAPEGYFESFEDKVLSRLKSESEEKSRRPILRSYIRPVIGIAASILVIIVIGLFSVKSAKDKVDITFNDLDSAEIANYVSNLELSDEEFEEFIPDYTVDSLYKEEITFEFINSNFSPSELENLEEEFDPLSEDIEI